MEKRTKQRKISQTMIKWLLICMVIVFALATVLTHMMQTELSHNSTDEQLRLNIDLVIIRAHCIMP